MKKVLILAYDFPPYVSAGGLRPHNWYLHLKANEYEPIVVTRQWDTVYGDHRDYVAPSKSEETLLEESELGTIIRAPHKPNLSERMVLKYGRNKLRFIRKLITFSYETLQYIFPIGPKHALYKEAKKYLKNNPVDLIVATGDPFVLFKYASKLSKRHNTKWIADYRDPWTQDVSLYNRKLLKWWYTLFECRFLRNVSAVSTVSEYVKTTIEPNIPAVPYCIQKNGYNGKHIQAALAIQQSNDILSIGFAGSIYQWHPIHDVLENIEKFASLTSSDAIRIRFFGTNIEHELREFIDEKCPTIQDSVFFIPKLPNDELVKELSKDNLLLLFNDYEILGTKIFNYLGVKRKILLCYSDCEKAKILKEAYFYYSTPDDAKNLQSQVISYTHGGEIVRNGEHLIELLQTNSVEFASTKEIKCDSVNTDEYTRERQIKSFSEFLNTIL